MSGSQNCVRRRAVLLRSFYSRDRSANRNGAGRLRTLRARCENRQGVLLFPSSESKTIPFNKDGLANVLSFGGQRCRPWQYARKRRKDCQTLSKRHGPTLRKVLPTNFRS